MSNVLIHIGFPKAGSTYLQQWFESHPELYFQGKHFAQGFYDAWELARYAERSRTVPKRYVLSCEDLTIFKSKRDQLGMRELHRDDVRQFQNNVCGMLSHIFPAAKILIVTRGYASIFHSLYSQYISMAGSLNPAEYAAVHKDWYTEVLDYNYVINLYRKAFGQDKVIVLPYELMRDDLPAFLSLIEKEMGVKKSFAFTKSKVNASYSPKILAAYYNTSNAVYKSTRLLPYALQVVLYKKYTKIVRGRQPHPFLQFYSRWVSNYLPVEQLNQLTEAMKGKADILKSEKLHQPYLKEYLIQ